VWRAALNVASRHQFPELSLDEGHRRLGRLFSAGFFETIIGKVIGSVLPFMSMELRMARMPKFVSMTMSGVVMDVVREGERRYRLRYRSPLVPADFTAGAIEASEQKTKAPVEVLIENRSPEGFDIVVTELG
jgi:uncharacterized protein (TIGR02265 family)